MPALIAPVLGIAQGAVGYALLQIGASLLLSTAASALLSGGRDQRSDSNFDLSLPTELPAYRFVYGHTLAVGTPAPIRVREDKIIGCWLLNSRPSEMANLKVFLDKREVTYTGDPFDFSGAGAAADTDPFLSHVTFWIGKGDQTTPPTEITTGWPYASGADEELFKTTDGWEGRTVLWAVLKAGNADERFDRWPNGAPLIEVEADYSLIWDPREGAQSLGDPATWTYSDNHALICLDALTQNPMKPYQSRNILIDQFEDAADVADELVDIMAGGTERRYTVAGTVIWADGELWQKIAPLFASGAARPTTIGGRRGIAPGQWEAPSYTLTDFEGATPEVIGTLPGDLPTQLVAEYRNPLRLFEPAELDPYDIPNAQTDDGGVPRTRNLDLKFAGSPTQAMRVQKIEGGLLRQQKQISLTAFSGAADLVAGATLTCNLAAPWNRVDGTYRVESINPVLSPLGEDGGVAMRCPMVARLHSADVYAWDETTDEQAIEVVQYNEGVDGVSETYLVPTLDAAAESGTTPGNIDAAYTTPNEPGMTHIEIWMSGTLDPFDAGAALSIARKNAVPNVTYSATFSAGTGSTRYVFAKVTGPNGSESPLTSATTVTTA